MLADRMFWDTSVFLRGLGLKPAEPHAALCEQLLKERTEVGVTTLVGAPTIAEYFRGGTDDRSPSTAGLRIVAFESEAAAFCGKAYGAHLDANAREAAKKDKRAIKFDAMIIACAAICRPSGFFTDDDWQAKRAAEAGLKVYRPKDLDLVQPTLF